MKPPIDKYPETVLSKSLATVMGVKRSDRQINWQFTPNERHLAAAIVARATNMFTRNGRKDLPDEQLMTNALMDILNVHMNGCPMDLHRFLTTSNDADFVHDFVGIFRYVDRVNGGLRNDVLFVPIFRMRTS